MSTAVYPVLAGLSWPVKKTPSWNTRVQKTVSGRELRCKLYSYPLYAIDLQYEFLRADQKNAEFQSLIGFYNARGGQFDSFYFDDQSDNTAQGQTFGVGDGATVSFQLVRTVGTFAEPVFALNGTPTILVDGSPTTDFTVGDRGKVVFNSPPPAGAVLAWSGQFYWVVRFAQDTMEFSEFLYNFWSLDKVQLTTFKP